MSSDQGSSVTSGAQVVPPAPASGGLPAWVWLAVAVVGSLLLCLPVLTSDMPLLADDYSILSGLVADGELDGARMLSHFTLVRHGAYYRPVFYNSYALPFLVSGVEPLPFYVMNSVLHGVNAWLLFVVLIAMGAGRRWALLSLAVFLCHPLHVECIAWVAARSALIGTLFFLAALIGFARYRRRPTRASLLGLGTAFALAALTREDVLVLPGVLVAFDVLLPLGARATRLSRARKVAPYLVVGFVLVANLLARHHARSDALGGWLSIAQDVSLEARMAPLLMSLKRVALPYVGGIVGDLSTMARLAIALPTVLLLLLGLVRPPGNQRRLWLLGLVLMVFCVVPAIPVLDMDQDLMHVRHMYLPSVGLCMLLAAGGSASFRARWLVALGRVLVVLMIAGGAVLLVINCRAYIQAGQMGREFISAVRASGVRAVVVPAFGRVPYADRDGDDVLNDNDAFFAPQAGGDEAPALALLINPPRRHLGAHIYWLGLTQALMPLFGEPGVHVLFTDLLHEFETPGSEEAFFGPLLRGHVPVLKWDGEQLVTTELVDQSRRSVAARLHGKARARRLGSPRLLGEDRLPWDDFEPRLTLPIPEADRVPDAWRYRILGPYGPRVFEASPQREGGLRTFDPWNEVCGPAWREMFASWRSQLDLAPYWEEAALVLLIEGLADDEVVSRSSPVLLFVDLAE